MNPSHTQRVRLEMQSVNTIESGFGDESVVRHTYLANYETPVKLTITQRTVLTQDVHYMRENPSCVPFVS